MSELLIKNAQIVNEGTIQTGDLRVRDGRIDAIASELDAGSRTEVLDAGGNYLMPGMIDDQVHFRTPGLSHKGDLTTESRAAVAGGVTSFMDMPNVQPPTIDNQALHTKIASAEGKCAANFGFHLGATNDNIDSIKAADQSAAAGIKIFMGASTGRMLVDDDDALEAIFEHAPLTVLTHCEETPMIEAALARARAEYGDDIPMAMHPTIRSREACLASSRKAVDLAQRHGTQLHILHLTTADELALFTASPMAGKSITAEACVHHLWFCDADYDRLGTRIKCNPAIKTDADRQAIRRAVAEDRIDILATDHAPHLIEEKDGPYTQAAAGMPLAQYVLVALVDMAESGWMSLPQLVQKTAHNVAERFQVAERGYLREGYWADLVVVDPSAPTVVDAEPVHAHCGWTPFTGQRFNARVQATVVSGQIAYCNDTIQPVAAGQALCYAR
ncbi:dihydroorotase [Salinisphaera sp. USBA-960]|uniref:dihydroorotase n=1 Tax=Salinisphaera orenii TaxID=856731 RepID=UPI000DBE3FF9|nr:dihydroorotase [Salifodinibacter halophilus]NNC26706.1 dihydroorotase [Salifodinibacter halophilus]